MLEIISYPSTNRLITHLKDDIYYICLYTNNDLTDAKLKSIHPHYDFENSFAQLYDKRDALENIIKNSFNHKEIKFDEEPYFFNNGDMLINGSIIRLISNKPFFKYENGEFQVEEPPYANECLFFKFIVSSKIVNPNIWIENPEIEIINQMHHLTSDSHIQPLIPRDSWEDDPYWL